MSQTPGLPLEEQSAPEIALAVVDERRNLFMFLREQGNEIQMSIAVEVSGQHVNRAHFFMITWY